MKRSSWMKGLLHAEAIGIRGVTELLYRNEYQDVSLEFLNGVLDYITNYKLRNL